MKRNIKFIALLILTALMLSTLSICFTLSADETPYISITFDKDWLYVGETYTPTVVKSSDDLTITWHLNASSSSVVSVSSSGQITALSVGNAVVTAYSPEIGSSQHFLINVYDSLGIESGLSYYIMNVESQRLMSSASTNSADYANVVTSNRSWQAKSRWQAVEQTDGSFKLKAFAGSSGVVLEANGTNIEIETDDNGSAEKFRITRVENGDKQGLYLITNGYDYVTQNSATSGYNVYLSDEPNDFSYWSFMKVEKGWAEFFCFQYPGFNTSNDDSSYDDLIDYYGYTKCEHLNHNSDHLYYELPLCDLMLYAGHGTAGALSFKNADGVYGQVLAYSDDNYPSATPSTYAISTHEYNALSSIRCVMYMSCLSGNDSRDGNLLVETYEKGAHFVFGITVEINTYYCSAWTNNFFNQICGGSNISEAIEEADSLTSEFLFSDGRDSDGNYTYTTLSAIPSDYIGDAYQYLTIGYN